MVTNGLLVATALADHPGIAVLVPGGQLRLSAMSLVQSDGLFQPLEQQTLDHIPARYRPDDNSWTGFSEKPTFVPT